MYIEIILFQQDEFRHIAEKISDLKERWNKKDKPVYDDKILYFTKVFNDRIYEKYGMEYLMEGIHNLIQFECTPKHIFDYTHLKKGYFKEKNRIKILTEGLQKNKPVRIFESDEIFKNERVTEPEKTNDWNQTCYWTKESSKKGKEDYTGNSEWISKIK